VALLLAAPLGDLSIHLGARPVAALPRLALVLLAMTSPSSAGPPGPSTAPRWSTCDTGRRPWTPSCRWASSPPLLSIYTIFFNSQSTDAATARGG